jgi:acetoacetyl-CoA synthetase
MQYEVSPHKIPEGALLWEPSERDRGRSNIAQYMHWLEERRGLKFAGYPDLWACSVTDLEGFWSSIWEFFRIRARGSSGRALEEPRMPGARWFPGAELDYAEHTLARRDEHPAVIAESETRAPVTLTYAELYRQTAAVAGALRQLGVRRGDRVVGYLPNIPETLVAFLATASLGAVWASCPPEFGVRAVVERFRQVEPRLLLAADGYRFRGRAYDRLAETAELQANLPSLEHTVIVPYQGGRPARDAVPGALRWSDLLREPSGLTCAPVPFDHPLWILYSSGTTGLPKAIVHGHGGILLEHLKTLALHLDLGGEDRFSWHTTTGWMMWDRSVHRDCRRVSPDPGPRRGDPLLAPGSTRGSL